jgi:signal transduction histidine kinase
MIAYDYSPAVRHRRQRYRARAEATSQASTLDRARAVTRAALLFASSRELPAVLGLVAQRTALLFDGICQVRFAPPGRPADTRRVIASPEHVSPVLAGQHEGESYSALLAHLSERGRGAAATAALRRANGRGPGGDDAARAAESGAALLIAPLIAQGRRIGTIDVVTPALPGADAAAEQQLLRAIAAHAAQAIDVADQLALLQPSVAPDPLKERAESQQRMLALLLHDLKNPFTALRSSLQLIMKRVDCAQQVDPGQIAHLLRLADTALTQLEEQLGDLCRPPAARAAPQDMVRCPLDLVALTGLLVNLYQQTTSRHQLTLSADVARLEGCWQRAHLERLIGNLLANAIKYSPAGGSIKVAVGREEDAPGAWAVIRVQDQGIGIPSADLARVSRQNARAGNVGAIPGTGLGLASVRELVELYEGVLAFTSEVGAGTTVQIRLPLARGQAAGAPHNQA